MTAEPSSVENAAPETSGAADAQRNKRCAHCGQPPLAKPRQAPFALLISVARLIIAAGAAIMLTAIVIYLLRWGRLRPAAGELWALFATFVLAIGVLLLYEIRDALLRHPVQPQAAPRQPLPRSAIARPTGLATRSWRRIGALARRVWLPFQSERDRRLIDHLALHEQRELLDRLAVVTLCFVATTLAPVLIAFVFLSPTAVCIAATAIAANLFILDWFKKRHKRWLYSTHYASEHAIAPSDERRSAINEF